MNCVCEWVNLEGESAMKSWYTHTVDTYAGMGWWYWGCYESLHTIGSMIEGCSIFWEWDVSNRNKNHCILWSFAEWVNIGRYQWKSLNLHASLGEIFALRGVDLSVFQCFVGVNSAKFSIFPSKFSNVFAKFSSKIIQFSSKIIQFSSKIFKFQWVHSPTKLLL